MKRVYNFSAGPAVLPEEVLREAAEEMLDYNGTGMSVMEMSHRSKAFEEIIQTAEQDLRDLMHIPDNYTVLFLQGGASQQFSAIPMNLMKNGVADYIVTGQWAKKAYQEAQKYGKAVKIASSEDETFSYIPDCSDLPIDPDADYVYICENNTIYGTKFKTLPNTKGKPLVADVSSCFLSEPVDDSGRNTDCKHPDHAEMEDTGRRKVPVQYTAGIWHLHLRQGIQVAEEDGRTGSHPEAERRKGCHPLQLPRPEQAVQGHCPQGRPFSDECAVCHWR